MTKKEGDPAQANLFPRYPGYCSFCRKHYSAVVALAEGPDQVYICYECTQICARMLEAEFRRRGVEPPKIE